MTKKQKTAYEELGKSTYPILVNNEFYYFRNEASYISINNFLINLRNASHIIQERFATLLDSFGKTIKFMSIEIWTNQIKDRRAEVVSPTCGGLLLLTLRSFDLKFRIYARNPPHSRILRSQFRNLSSKMQNKKNVLNNAKGYRFA